MLRVTIDDHTGRPVTYLADCYEGFVEAICEDAFLPFDSVEEWMEGMVSRHELWDGSMIRMDSAKNFITDLDACGSIRLQILH